LLPLVSASLLDRFKLSSLDISLHLWELKLGNPEHSVFFFKLQFELLSLILKGFGLILNFLHLLPLLEVFIFKLLSQFLLFLLSLNWWQRWFLCT
jgi:hypothetical protein